MRKLLTTTTGFVILAVGAAYLWTCRAPTPPSASIRVMGYTPYADSLVATIVLTNTGGSALNYHDSSQGVFYRVLARVHGHETNLSSGGGPGSMAGPIVVWPARDARIDVALPNGTETWRCAIPVQRTGPRIRVFMLLGDSGIWNRTYPVSQWVTCLFPLGNQEETEIQSDTFMVPANVFP